MQDMMKEWRSLLDCDEMVNGGFVLRKCHTEWDAYIDME